MGKILNEMKQKNQIVVHKTTQELYSSFSGNNYYEDDDDDDEKEEDGKYVQCDPFSKLKYDDLRKVHKDQTVFAVSERDFEKVQKYSSIDHLQRERGTAVLTPIEKTQAEQMLVEKEEAIRKTMMAKKHADNLKSMEYVEKNKSVMSSFFQLTY